MIDIASLLALAAGTGETLPDYGMAIRCAGLSEAAGDQRSGETSQEKQLFDAALFWGLAASERARKDGRSAPRFTEDQRAAKERAAAELRAEGRETAQSARAQLARCLRGVPPAHD